METYVDAFQHNFGHLQDSLFAPVGAEAYRHITPLQENPFLRAEDITSLHQSEMQAAQQQIAEAMQQASHYQHMAAVNEQLLVQERQNLAQAQAAAAAAAYVAAMFASDILQVPVEALLRLPPQTLLELTTLLKLLCDQAQRDYIAAYLLKCSTEEAAAAVLPAVTIMVLITHTGVQAELVLQLIDQQPTTTQQLLQATQVVSNLSGSAIWRWQRCGSACSSFADVEGLIKLAHLLAQEAAASHLVVISTPPRPSAPTRHPAPGSARALLPFAAPKLLLSAPTSLAAWNDMQPAAGQQSVIAAPAACTGPMLLPLPATSAPLCSPAYQHAPSEQEPSTASAPADAASFQPLVISITQADSRFDASNHDGVAAGELAGERFVSAPAAMCALTSHSSLNISSNSLLGSSSDCCYVVVTAHPVLKSGAAAACTTATQLNIALTNTAAARFPMSVSALVEATSSSAAPVVSPAAASTTTNGSSSASRCQAQCPLAASGPTGKQLDSKRPGRFGFGKLKFVNKAADESYMVNSLAAAAAESAAIDDAGCLDDSLPTGPGKLHVCRDSSSISTTTKNSYTQSNIQHEPVEMPVLLHVGAGGGSSTTTTTDSCGQSGQHAVELPSRVPFMPSFSNLAGSLKSRAKGAWRKVHSSLQSKRSKGGSPS